MSVLDVFFGRGGGAFRSARCKTLLKLTIPRIKLLRNKREMQLKQMRRDIANLLGSGQEATARIRVEHIIREENMKAAQEILELFCELIVVRLPIIEIQRECPLDLKEAISSVCFAAPRCADLPELQQAQMMFAAKYGRDFVNAASELLPDSGVNRQVIELLSVRAPPNEVKVKLLKEIAEEHGVEWDPLDSETQYEDLLNGSNSLVNLTAKLEKTSTVQQHPKSDSDSELDLDLPDVPTASVPPSLSKDHEHEDLASPNSSNQFLPFIAPPPNPGTPTLAPPPPPPEIFTETPLNPQMMTSAPLPPPSPLPPEVFTEAPLNSKILTSAPPPLPSSPPAEVSTEVEKHSTTFSSQKSHLDKDLHDAVAAANAAALTAERAAAAARLAASLAQVKIAELEERTTHDSEQTISKREVDKREEPLESIRTVAGEDSLAPSSADGRQTLRTVSMEDDPYFSYPNLFSRQNSSAKEHTTVADSSAAAPTARLAASLAQVKKAKLEERNDLVSEKTISEREDNKEEEPLESVQAVVGEDNLGPPSADGRQTLRTVSMEDDQYFSYPNLFSRQNSSAMEHTTGTDSSAR